MNTPSESVPRTVKRIKAEAVNVLTEELPRISAQPLPSNLRPDCLLYPR